MHLPCMAVLRLFFFYEYLKPVCIRLQLFQKQVDMPAVRCGVMACDG